MHKRFVAILTVLLMTLPACARERTYTREEWEAMQSSGTMDHQASSSPAVVTTQAPKTRQAAPTRKPVTAAPATTRLAPAPKPEKTTKAIPPTRAVATNPPPTVAPPVVTQRPQPETTYEEELRALTEDYQKHWRRACEERDRLETKKNQIVAYSYSYNDTMQREITALERERDNEVARMMANTGGQMNSNVQAIRDSYNRQIAAKQREWDDTAKVIQNDYNDCSDLLDTAQMIVNEQTKQYNQKVVDLKAKYGIS